ncbi:hypothetical protein GALMADRAFT_144391 [Galerina marginata CBS 339.88]|uniref:Uncharacterized protein n=1 Tax=Galerina marginata (strain CBS 339.88) TaxID=685588 RepID=A0A067SLN7_GALM3|nr:hypothetical protein GALMADRAFT_144391 [Galerina marginata CBS 339.88]
MEKESLKTNGSTAIAIDIDAAIDETSTTTLLPPPSQSSEVDEDTNYQLALILSHPTTPSTKHERTASEFNYQRPLLHSHTILTRRHPICDHVISLLAGLIGGLKYKDPTIIGATWIKNHTINCKNTTVNSKLRPIILDPMLRGSTPTMLLEPPNHIPNSLSSIPANDDDDPILHRFLQIELHQIGGRILSDALMNIQDDFDSTLCKLQLSGGILYSSHSPSLALYEDRSNDPATFYTSFFYTRPGPNPRSPPLDISSPSTYLPDAPQLTQDEDEVDNGGRRRAQPNAFSCSSAYIARTTARASRSGASSR